MMSELSKQRLSECHPDIRRVIEKVAERWDITVSCGHRDKKHQDEAVMTGKSKAIWPTSKHNSLPSRAVDIEPLDGKKINWADRERFVLLAGYVLGVAEFLGVGLRWGGDWNQNTVMKDNKFDDLPHFELED
jgi:peptidoglycan L-alanyl-D-glutamate endopeptidase CwlK